MKTPNIVTAAKTECTFEHYADGSLTYSLAWIDDQGEFRRFTFPIPVSDTGGGFFHSKMPGLYLMRWIRKEIIRLQEEAEMIAEAKRQWEKEQAASE